MLGSVAGLESSPASLYSATKWATTGLAENPRLHATTGGIGVTLVNPGLIDTPFWQDAGAPSFALPPQPIAEAIRLALDQPAGVDVNTLTIRPVGQPRPTPLGSPATHDGADCSGWRSRAAEQCAGR